jgi:c-di-GMP-binding flagellar brake protein YcgR
MGARESDAKHLQLQVRSIDSIRPDVGGAHRIASSTEGDASATGQSESGSASAPTFASSPNSEQINFKALKLRPGMIVQAQSTGKGAERYDAQYLGIIEGKGIMVVPDGVLSLKHGMKAGENFIIRGFTGQYDFTFASNVIRLFDYSYRDPPLAYALLSYPETIEAKQVRGAMRVRATLPITVWSNRGTNPVAANFMDLSVAGALIKSPVALGALGELVNLTFAIDFEDEKLDLVVPATICRNVKANSEDAFLTGVLFQNISRNDKLALYYFVLSSTA